MKRALCMAAGTLLLLGVSVGSAQSQSQPLGDVARSAKKNKPQQTTQSRYFDNDNLPTNETLSVVGPAPSANAQSTTSVVANAAATEHQNAAIEIQQKIDSQKAKLDSLNHELDLEQREYRLRAAAFYGDAGERLRNAAQWDKDDTEYKSDIDSKQKAIESTKQQLDELQEEARKAGLKQKDDDSQPAPNQGK